MVASRRIQCIYHLWVYPYTDEAVQIIFLLYVIFVFLFLFLVKNENRYCIVYRAFVSHFQLPRSIFNTIFPGNETRSIGCQRKFKLQLGLWTCCSSYALVHPVHIPRLDLYYISIYIATSAYRWLIGCAVSNGTRVATVLRF